MRKSIKAIICAASAVVMCAAPTIPALSGTLAPMAITASAASNSTAYRFTRIGGYDYIYADGLIYKITKKAESQVTPGEVSIVGVHSSAKDRGYELKAPSYIEYESRHYDITSVGNMSTTANNFKNYRVNSEYLSLVSLDLILCEKLTKIENSAFSEMLNLESVTLPFYLQTIGSSAFQQSGITHIDITGNVTSIGKCAFLGCESLHSVLFSNKYATNELAIGSQAFDYCKNLQNVYIARSSLINPDKYAQKNTDTIKAIFPRKNGKPIFNCSKIDNDDDTYLNDFKNAFYL